MKHFFLFIMVCVALSSCAPTTYYQMYQTQPISDISMRDHYMVFEDENCEVFYNFWKEYGEIGFVFHNKTSQNLYLHLDESFFVENDIAYDYYRNRIFTNSRSYITSSQLSNIYGSSVTKSNASAYSNYYQIGSNGLGNAYGNQTTYKNGYVYGSTGTITNTTSNSVSVAEKQIICIPPETSKIITEFDITSSVYRSCDLYRNPRRKDSHSVSFNQDNTPLTFGNRIAYSIGDNEELIRINNDFYVSKISNYSSFDITQLEYIEVCGKQTQNQVRVFKESGPNQFYIHYLMNGGSRH